MKNPYSQAHFLTSAARFEQCPPDEGVEIAFAGRSNAGKSSALNAITRQKSLARTSKTPGRTQLINFFEVTENVRLVDLPGYGYAKVPLAMKQAWQHHLSEYLAQRRCLQGLVLLMDVRHPLTEFDEEMLNWAEAGGLSIHILLTKADKLKRGAAKNMLLAVRKALKDGQLDATVQLFSATKLTGLEELLKVLNTWSGLNDGQKETPAFEGGG